MSTIEIHVSPAISSAKFTGNGTRTLTTFASDLGWRAGNWLASFVIDGRLFRFHENIMSHGAPGDRELLGRDYRAADGTQAVIWND